MPSVQREGPTTGAAGTAQNNFSNIENHEVGRQVDNNNNILVLLRDDNIIGFRALNSPSATTDDAINQKCGDDEEIVCQTPCGPDGRNNSIIIILIIVLLLFIVIIIIIVEVRF